MPFETIQRDIETVILNEVSQTEKDKHVTYMCNLKKKKATNELIFKTEIELPIQKIKVSVARRWGKGGRDELGDWDGHIGTAGYKADNQ